MFRGNIYRITVEKLTESSVGLYVKYLLFLSILTNITLQYLQFRDCPHTGTSRYGERDMQTFAMWLRRRKAYWLYLPVQVRERPHELCFQNNETIATHPDIQHIIRKVTLFPEFFKHVWIAPNIDRDTDDRDWVPSWSSSFPPGKRRDSSWIRFRRFLSNSHHSSTMLPVYFSGSQSGELGPFERVVRVFTAEVTLDQTMGNWYHFKPTNLMKQLLTKCETVFYYLS